MGSGNKRPFDAKLLAGYTYDPDDLFIVEDKKHPEYDPGAHDELDPGFVANIAKNGIGLAVLIRKNADGLPQVVDGRKRVRAAREINASRTNGDRIMVPCTTRKGTAVDAAAMSVALNVHRTPPDPRRELIAKAQRLSNLGHPLDAIANDLGVTEKTARRLVNADPKPPAKKKRQKATNPPLKLIRACAGKIMAADLSPDARSILQWAAGELPTEALQKELPGLFA